MSRIDHATHFPTTREDNTVVGVRPKTPRAFTVVRVGEIWTLADIDALETVCRQLRLHVERIDAAESTSPRDLIRPVLIKGRTAKHKAADFAQRMRLLTPNVRWLVVELEQPTPIAPHGEV